MQSGQGDRSEIQAIAPGKWGRGVGLDGVGQGRRRLAQLVALVRNRLLLNVEGDPAEGGEKEDGAQSAKATPRVSLVGHRRSP